MNTWINLSLEINESTLSFPGDEGLKVHWQKTQEKDGYNLSRLCLNMHLGTHIDFKKHLFDLEDKITFDQFIGKANVIFIEPKQQIIRTQDIEKAYQYINQKEKTLIISTQQESLINTEAYFVYPKFEITIVDFLIKHQIKLIGSDLPSYEYLEGPSLKMHQDLLKNNIYLIENMVQLHLLHSHIDLLVLTFPIQGLEASLVRAIAKNM